MKEEGEITDDDVEENRLAETAESSKDRHRVLSRKRKRASERDRRPFSDRNDAQRSSASRKSRDHVTSYPPRNRFIPALTRLPEDRLPRLRYRNNQASGSSRKDAEVITIDDDSDNTGHDDCEVFEVKISQEDDELDELQLRRDALDSAVKFGKIAKTCTSSSGNAGNLIGDLESQSVIDLCSDSSVQNLADLPDKSSSVQSSVEKSCASESAGIGVSVTASNQHVDSNQCVSEDPAIFSVASQSSASTSKISVTTELSALPVSDSAYTNYLVAGYQTLQAFHNVQQTSGDNYDEVEMDLDSDASDFEYSVVVSSSELPKQSPGTLVYSVALNQCTSPSPTSLISSAVAATVDFVPTSVCNSSTSASPILDGSSSITVNQVSESPVVHDDRIQAPTDTKTEPLDLGNLQQQRKAKDADKKSELLLRAAVLQSLSSKRQQQVQLDTVLSVPRERPKSADLQVTTHSTKRTVTPTLNNQLTVQLPVHQPVVIPMTGESSDSDGDQLEVADFSAVSSTAVIDSSVKVTSNIDRFIREIRRTTEGPKSEVHNMTSLQPPMSSSSVKFEETHKTSESALWSQCRPSNGSLVSFSDPQRSLLMKHHMASSSAKIGNIAPKENSGQNMALRDLKRQLSCEKGKLQQEKITLSKAKLRMARKKEQVITMEKRVRKLREQLVAAEKISASSKRQLENLRDETTALSHGIELRQKSISQLEIDLQCIGKKHIVPLLSLTGFDSQNTFQAEILSGNPHYSVDSKALCRLSSAAHSQKDLASRLTAGDASDRRVVTTKALRCSNAAGSHTSESIRFREDEVKEMQGETLSKIECSETAEHTDSLFSDINRDQSVGGDLSSSTKTNISVAKPNVPDQQKAGGNGDLVSDGTCGILVSSTTADEFSVPSDKRIKQIVYHYNSSLDKNLSACMSSPHCPLSISDPVFSFQLPVAKSTSITSGPLASDDRSDVLEIGDSFCTYQSSLLCFKSYRFSSFYCKNEGLSVSSETFSNKLECHTALCKFDLMGRCLDDSCQWQHQSDYSLTRREQLVDIISYHPQVAGVDNSTPPSQYERLLNQYAERRTKDFVHTAHSSHHNLLVDDVKRSAGLFRPHAVCLSSRAWKLPQNKRKCATGSTSDFPFSSDDVSEIGVRDPAYSSSAVLSLLSGSLAADDARYWTAAEAEEIKDLEEAITAAPSDDSVWLKLAHARMTEKRGSSTHDECIAHGLSVLARAVEANPSNGRLWTQYLDLYMERLDAENDASTLYEQAILRAPSYQFFWKYLQLPLSFSDKMDICKRLRQYLCSPRCSEDSDTRSHHLLETVIYQAALCTVTGRFKDGLQVIQAIVQSKASVVWLGLSASDRIAMWLSFIHLYECRQLSDTLFDPAESRPGPIVSRQPFVVPFRVDSKPRISYETLLKLFESAVGACDRDTKDESGEYCSWLAALHRSRLLLELCCRGSPAARQLCEDILQRRPNLVDIWLCLIELLAAEHNTPSSSVSSTVKRAIASNPHSVTLFLAGICALIQKGDNDAALGFAEDCSISLYDVDALESAMVDPNLLYCCLLDLPLPPGYRAPALRPSVLQQYVADQQANLWLSYSLLLDLQGAHAQAVDAYHEALSCVTRTADVRRLWVAYLRRSAAVLCGRVRWLSSSDDECRLWQRFESDVVRALASLPVKQTFPHSSLTWNDYSCHNEIVRLYASCISDADLVQDLYEKYMRRMPGNVNLVLTAVELLSKDERAVQLCEGLCFVGLHSCPRSAALWNQFLGLSRRTASVGRLRSLYAKATTLLPFEAGLWKFYIMFEVINKSQDHVKKAVEKCRSLQVNVDSFVESLLK